MRRLLYVVAVLLIAGAAAAQDPIFAPDSAIDPRERSGPAFISRLVIGAGRALSDGFRPLDQDAGFVHLTNSIHWSHFQFQYNHSETRGEHDSGAIRVRRCGCAEEIYFPTPRPPGAVPAAPPPGSREMAQFAYYRVPGDGPAKRYRLTYGYQRIGTDITTPEGGELHRSGRERSFRLDADTELPIGGHRLFGTLFIGRTAWTGTVADRRQSEIVYTHLFPIVSLPKGVLLRTKLTAGGITNRGASGVNVLNPLIELFWRDYRTRMNFHLVYSPQTLRDAGGWRTHHQLAAFIDRALVVQIFQPR
jgi:hypothetical protein